MKLFPPAKLNLTLEIIRKRPDGFHDLRSIVLAVGLYDELSIDSAPSLGLECDPPELGGEENLVLKAARLLQAGRPEPHSGAWLHLKKGIPQAAGLGGGSADAAATLVGLNRLWNLGLTVWELQEMGSRLGSDVPFFLGSPLALAEGRGEKLTPLKAPLSGFALLVFPILRSPQPPDKTRMLYGALAPEDFCDGAKTDALIEWLRSTRPPTDPTNIPASASIPHELLVNSFERAAAAIFPEIITAKEAMLDSGAPFARLSGSGPTLYSLFSASQEEWAKETKQKLVAQDYWAHIAPILTEPPLVEG